MATHPRSVSWLSLSSVRRPAATPPPPTPTPTPTPPPARSDSIRPPAFKPFRTLSSAQPQKPTWPPTTIGATTPAQTPQPPLVQRPPFRSATATTAKPAAASPPPQPAAAAAQRSSPPPTLTITSPAASNAPKAQTTTTSPALKSSQPIAITTNLSSPSTILQQFNNSSPQTEHNKSVLVQQVTEKSNQVPPNYTKHHKLQSTTQIAKAGVAFQEKGVAMQRKYLEEPKKHGMRIVRLVGDNIGAAMIVNSSRNKEKNHPKTLQSKSSSATTLFMNSNVQGVNNSIAFDSCLTHQDPGLHVCTFEP